MRKIKQICCNERGDLSTFTFTVILTINILLAYMLLFTTISINTMNIRNAAKMELNNISARIYADTFQSQREANMSSYLSKLNSNSTYQTKLKNEFIDGLKKRISISNSDYTISNIELEFKQYSTKIEYTFRCKVKFTNKLFGSYTKTVNLTGSHNTKY